MFCVWDFSDLVDHVGWLLWVEWLVTGSLRPCFNMHHINGIVFYCLWVSVTFNAMDSLLKVGPVSIFILILACGVWYLFCFYVLAFYFVYLLGLCCVGSTSDLLSWILLQIRSLVVFIRLFLWTDNFYDILTFVLGGRHLKMPIQTQFIQNLVYFYVFWISSWSAGSLFFVLIFWYFVFICGGIAWVIFHWLISLHSVYGFVVFLNIKSI